MKNDSLQRVIYCGQEDALFKKLSKHARDFVFEASPINFKSSPQKFAQQKKASVLILKIKSEFNLKYQEWLSRNDSSVPILIFCQNGNVQTTIHALQYGVFDYFCTSQSIDLLIQRIREALAWTSASTVKRLKETSHPLLLGHDPQIVKANQEILTLLNDNKPVLLTGEIGTGKEHLAYGAYQIFFRGLVPFIRYDCRLLKRISQYDGTDVPVLIKKRLQDFKKKAVKGVLFLNHIEELSRDQVEEVLSPVAASPFRVVGSYQEPIGHAVEKKPPAISNTIRIPALRLHKDDLPVMLDYFIKKTAKKRKIRYKSVSRDVIACMQEYHWPGNVQELANVIERMMLLEPTSLLTVNSWRISQTYGAKMNFQKANRLSFLIEDLLKTDESIWKEGRVYGNFMARMERMLIELVLPKVEFNQATAAKVLGISRNTLRQKLK